MKVTIIQKSIEHYRVPFFEMLKKKLSLYGIELQLVYGEKDEINSLKNDTVEIDWGIKIKNTTFKLGTRLLYWQPCLKYINNSDLIIVEQASKLLVNYILVFHQLASKKKIAFWGHGSNLQSNNHSILGEYIKKYTSCKVHWWFAYNNYSAAIVNNLGYPKERITSVYNSIDTKKLVDINSSLNGKYLEVELKKLNIKSKNVSIFSGGMYSEKRINFLLESCLHLKNIITDFEIIFIGDGVESYKVKNFIKENKWAHYFGTKFDIEKVILFSAAKILLIPGAVGLVILDSFALEVPIITIEDSNHGPEFDYIENGFNAIILNKHITPLDYALAASKLLLQDLERNKIIKGCKISKNKYTIENMTNNFIRGIINAISN